MYNPALNCYKPLILLSRPIQVAKEPADKVSCAEYNQTQTWDGKYGASI